MATATEDGGTITEIASRRAKEEAEALNGNGKSIEDLAEEEMVEDDEGQQLLDFGDHVNLSVKGRKPTDSEIKIKAISRPIKGQLGDKGDDEFVTLLVRARLDDLHIVSKRDGDGRVVAKTRRHVFTPVSILPIPEEQHDQIENIVG